MALNWGYTEAAIVKKTKDLRFSVCVCKKRTDNRAATFSVCTKLGWGVTILRSVVFQGLSHILRAQAKVDDVKHMHKHVSCATCHPASVYCHILSYALKDPTIVVQNKLISVLYKVKST